MALEREMSTPPIPSRSVAQFTFADEKVFSGKTGSVLVLVHKVAISHHCFDIGYRVFHDCIKGMLRQ